MPKYNLQDIVMPNDTSTDVIPKDISTELVTNDIETLVKLYIHDFTERQLEQVANTIHVEIYEREVKAGKFKADHSC